MEYPLWKKFFNSRKFWAFAVGFGTVFGAAIEDSVFTQEEVMTIAALVIGYVFSVAFEDGMSNRNAPALGVNWNSLQDSGVTVTEDKSSVTVVEKTGD